MSLICRAIAAEDKIIFSSVISNGSTLAEIIEDDKKYGKMVPYNGKYFTYKCIDWQGKWIDEKQISRGMTLVWNKIQKIISIDAREALPGEFVDFPLYFRRLADDPLLTKNTLQYQFYPINDFDSPHRGVCVVNADFPWTVDGEGIPLHIYDPEHYPNHTNTSAMTWDFDAVYEHEATGHGLGLPHSPHVNTKMYGNYGGMAESVFDESPLETIPRLQAKYPKEEIKESRLKRWIRWFKIKQD